MITASLVEVAAYEIMRKAAIEIPDDYKTGIRTMCAAEENELSRFVLQSMIEYSTTVSIAKVGVFIAIMAFLQWRPQGLFTLRTRSLA